MRGDAVNEELERPVDSGPLTEENAGAVVYYCGEVYPLVDDRVFTIGRDADLCIDENPYLHRRFLEITIILDTKTPIILISILEN